MKQKIVNFILNYYIIFCVYAFIGWIYEVSWYLIVRHEFVNRGVLFGPFLPVYGFGILILLLILKNFMKKKHYLTNMFYMIISSITITTFLYTTFIEYTSPKIYQISNYFNQHGIPLIILNVVVITLVYTFFKNKKIDVTVILTFLLIWIITTIIEYVAHFLTFTYMHTMLWDYSQDFLNINSRVNWDASRNFAIGGTILLYLVQPLIDKLLFKVQIKTKLMVTLIIGIPMIIDIIISLVF